MSKTHRFLSFIILFLLVILWVPNAKAASCLFSYEPQPNQNMDKLRITIKSNDLVQDTYTLQLRRPNGTADSIRNIQFTRVGIVVEFSPPQATGWLTGEYKLYFVQQNKLPGEVVKIADCSTSFTIQEIPEQLCVARVITRPIDPDTNVVLEVTGIAESNQPNPDTGSGGYDIFINNQFKFVYSTKIGNTIDLGKYPTGTYTVSIKNRCGVGGVDCSGKSPRLQCSQEVFAVAPTGSSGGGRLDTVTGITPANNKCDSKNPSYDAERCALGGGTGCGTDADPAIATAIGCIHTSPVGFIKDFLKFILGISGGLAFLLMLLGAFQMLTSAGNPETLSAGRDRLQSAIIGLLFVIFAVLLLKIIGVDILGIPGFTQ